MRITPLASGSAGNSFLVQCNGSAVLVDAGLSAKQISLRLDTVGIDPGSLKGILVSHGHSDHVKGVGVLSRKYKLPVWINEGTWSVVESSVGAVHRLEIFETGKVFRAAGFKIHPFSVPHDCVDPVGFRICMGSARLGIATDLGTATGLVTTHLTGLQVVVLESNHDPKMLMDGPYPWELKQRVRGRLGHLSNPDSARLLQRIFSDELQAVVLAHMSETNNRAELALECAQTSLREFLEQNGKICCARQDEVGPTIEW
ncbi:MAG: MBL fold metallo-hydrolase [Desulfomonile tiedjei]|nr:MBL fold metallo-hydrolase [Desulfomonile tiedjei]